MKKGCESGKSLISVIAPIVLFVLTMVGVTYAAFFSSNVPMQGAIETGVIENVIGSEISSVDVELLQDGIPVDYTGQTLTFTAAGDKKIFNLNLTNNSNFFLRYYYKLAFTSQIENGLENAVLVYYDEAFIGTLSALLYESEEPGDAGALPKGSYILPATVIPGISANKLTFELHMAAAEGYYKDKPIQIVITSYISTANYQNEFFVNNEEELFHAINDINEGIVGGKIILGSDITLTSGYTITSPVTIDLLGHKISFNGNDVTLKGDGKYSLISSVDTNNNNPTGEGGFVLDSLGAYLYIDNFGAGNYYAGMVDILSFDIESATAMLTELFEQKVHYGVKSGIELQLFEANGFYFNGKVSALYENSTPITSSLSYAGVNKTYPTFITIGAQRLDIKVLGSDDESVKETILASELKHIPNITGGMLENISRDLYLPVSIKDKNATIEWQSSNTQFMDNTGKIGSDVEGDTQILLTAIIRVNQSVFVENFEFVVYTLDNAKRFAYFLALLNPLTLNTINEYHYLPVVNTQSSHDYHNISTDIGFTSLDYSVENEYDYLTLVKEEIGIDSYDYSVGLNQAVFYNYAQINVQAVFLKGKTTEFSGIINVLIELGDKKELHDLVYNYISGELSKHNVLENILSTRQESGMAHEKGDFKMPLSYMNFDIAYSATGVQDGVINENSGIVSVTNGEDGFANIGIDATKFFGVPSGIPLFITITNTKVSVTIVRVLYFDTPAAIHNDQDGFYDKSVFNSVKYQVLQQLPTEERGGTSGYIIDLVNSTVKFDTVLDYILVRDIEIASKLVFQTYDGDILMQLLNWASSSINSGIDLSAYMSGNDYDSNGKTYILAEEAAAIRSYMDYIVTGKAGINKTEWLETWDTLWSANTYQDTSGMIIGYPQKITDLITAFDTLADDYVFPIVDIDNFRKGDAAFKFRELLSWATNMQDFGDTDNPAEPRINGGPPNSGIVGMNGSKNYYGWVVRDGLPTISSSHIIPAGTYQTSAVSTDGEKGVIDYYFYRIFQMSTTTDQTHINNYNNFINLWSDSLIYPTHYTTDGKTNIFQGIMEYLKGKLSNADYLSVYQLLTGFSEISDDLVQKYSSDDSLQYSYITSLDASTNGLSYFKNLTSLKVLQSPAVGSMTKLSVFSKPETLAVFFDRLTLFHPNLQTLYLRGAAFKGETELNIKNITRFENLKYIDLSYNTGITMLGEITGLTNIDELMSLDIRYTKSGAEYHEDYFKAMLTYIKSAAPSSVLKYINGSDEVFSLSSYSAEARQAYYALALLNDLDYFAGEYLQLAQKCFTDEDEVTHENTYSDIIWQMESGNPISEISLYDFPSYTGVGAGRDIASQMAEYFYVTGSFSSYSSNSVYRLTTNGLGSRVSNIAVIGSKPTLTLLRNSSKGYYYFTGPSEQYNSVWYLTNSIIYRGTSSSSLTTYFSAAAQVTTGNINAVLKSADNIRYYRHSNTSATTAPYYRNTVKSNPDLSFTANTLYSVYYNTTGAVLQAVSDPLSVESVLTLKGLLLNAPYAPHTINNYYFYTGATVTVGEKTYNNKYYYRLIINESTAELVEKNIGSTYTVYEGNTGFVSIPINDGINGIDKVYQPLDGTGQYTWTFEPYAIYTVCEDLLNGGYYLKRFGAGQLVQTETGVRLKNDRYYPNEGENYGGTGGEEEVVLTASITVGGVVYTRKFSVLIIG